VGILDDQVEAFRVEALVFEDGLLELADRDMKGVEIDCLIGYKGPKFIVN
jgi:hypothetical protein